MSKTRLRIGIETRQMAGHMTGIGNYSFLLLRALTVDPDLTFVGFGEFRWADVDQQTLARLGAAQAKTVQEPLPRQTPQRYLGQLARRAAKLSFARSAFRASQSLLFGRTVRSKRLDLFHALNFLPPSEPGVPTLPIVYDLSFLRHPESHPKERLKWLAGLRDVIARAPLVHTISEFSKAEIHSAYGYPLERIFVAPPAAAEIFRPLGAEATRREIETFDLTSSRYLLAVGTLEPRKNLRTLIAAYSRLREADQQRVALVIAGGSGWGDIDLPKEASTLVRTGRLRFVGAVSDAQLRSLYEGAAAFLFPSIYEGFGMPVVEAMRCGTAVVHSEATAMDEIAPGLAQQLPALDVDAWTNAMRQAANAPEAQDGAARAARIARAETYRWDTSAKAVRAAYAAITG
jgi:glycosyltransferase involved in cell wall biosynthesis